jgi:phage baseplate assembly protein gpV
MASPLDIFLQKLGQWGLEYFHRYYGLYRAEVKNVKDPEQRGRIQVQCPEVGHTAVLPKWVDPSFAAAGTNRGWFWPPEVGDSVWVSFERGDAARPNLYFGGWFGDKEVPSELGYPGKDKEPKRRGFSTRTGHTFVFNEEEGKEAVELYWRKPGSQPKDKETDARSGDKASLVFDKEGSILLTNKNGTNVVLDAKTKKVTIEDKDNNNKIVMDDKSITITGSKKVVVACDLIHLGVDDPSDNLALAKKTRAEIKALRDSVKKFVSTFNSHKHMVTGIQTAGSPVAHTQTAPVNSMAPGSPASAPPSVGEIKSDVVLSK